MKGTMRQISVVFTIIATLVVNALAIILPLNGLNTAEISDRFHVYFVPAGYVFSIWGLIYLGLIVFGIYQALPAQRANPRLQATGWWISLGGLANIAWIFLWHYEHFALTLVAMLTLLGTLIVTYIKLGIGRGKVPSAENWLVRVPFSLYLGWITVATVANITEVLDYVKWNGFGIAPEIWMGVVLLAVLAITVLTNINRRDLVFTLVILWALVGIAIKQASVSVVVISTWITFGLVAVTFIITLFLPRRSGSAM